MNITTLPVLILRNNILFPHDEIRLELDNEQNKELISLACSYYDKYNKIVDEKFKVKEQELMTV